MPPEKQIIVEMDAKELAAFKLGQEFGRREEREACAKVAADEEELRWNQINASTNLPNDMRELLIGKANTAGEIAAAIRSRIDGETG